MVYKSIRGLITADIKQHFSFAIPGPNLAVRTIGHPFKLTTTRYRLNIVNHLFFNIVFFTWNGLHEHVVNIEYFLLKSFPYCQLSICNHIQ